MNGPLATALLVAVTLAGPAATAANGEQFCIHGGQKPEKADLVACYSDAGCRFGGSLGAEPIRGYDQSSAPFALARGKITGIVTSSAGLIAQIKRSGRRMPQTLEPSRFAGLANRSKVRALAPPKPGGAARMTIESRGRAEIRQLECGRARELPFTSLVMITGLVLGIARSRRARDAARRCSRDAGQGLSGFPRPDRGQRPCLEGRHPHAHRRRQG